MKKTPKTSMGSPATLACLALGLTLQCSALPALAGKGGSKGKPGGDGGEDPPANPAPIEYQLTWIDGVSIRDCNSAGIAVGSYSDETGAVKLFWTTADGVINPLDNWWTLPPGYEDWRVGGQGAGMRINEDNLVCGVLRNEQTSEQQLFLANLFDPDSLEVFGPKEVEFPIPMTFVFMNGHGDVTWWSLVEGNVTTLHLYVRSLDQVFSWESGAYNYWPTGINDNLQISLIYRSTYPTSYLIPIYGGSGLLTFNVADPDASYVDDLGDYASSWEDPRVLSWGGLNNAGDVFGCFETEVSRIRYRNGGVYHRVADTKAGFIAADSTTWSELDPRLPVGGEQTSRLGYDPAACAMDVNEARQVLGGYKASGFFAEDLWLLDPVDGLFDVDDLVVGDPTEVEAFRAANNFSLVRITESIDPGTGYGIITGSFSNSDSPSFILTPRLVEQP